LAATCFEPDRCLWQIVAQDENDQRRQGPEREREAPDEFMVEIENKEHADNRERHHLTDREHELPAVSHHLPLALRHRFHDVGIAGRDVASERHAEEEADHRKREDARDERLRKRQHDEQHHCREKHDAAADLVG
jgi:hypothetical protein